ncbi:hypothetical protein GCM10010299_56060 [Streptomyces tanashiensis]|nr:hypothetical protein GCM10010299_56060 [Streptomyces tanashiensis]
MARAGPPRCPAGATAAAPLRHPAQAGSARELPWAPAEFRRSELGRAALHPEAGEGWATPWAAAPHRCTRAYHSRGQGDTDLRLRLPGPGVCQVQARAGRVIETGDRRERRRSRAPRRGAAP